MKSKSLRCLAWLVAAAAVLFADAPVKAADPIKIGFGMSLTGPLSPNGKMSLVAMQIWEDDTNAKGGLLGRPVKLVYYDDQSSPSQVPSIYAKLLDIDKVDLIVSGYASDSDCCRDAGRDSEEEVIRQPVWYRCQRTI